ncbi:unnamed protein product, partial [Rangifer tarandus platyrhynchus]
HAAMKREDPETTEGSTSTHIAKSGSQPTSRLQHPCKIPNEVHLDPQRGKNPGLCVHPKGETSHWGYGGSHL